MSKKDSKGYEILFYSPVRDALAEHPEQRNHSEACLNDHSKANLAKHTVQ